MKKSMYVGILILFAVLVGAICTIKFSKGKELTTKNIEGKVLSVGKDTMTLQDDEDVIYTFSITDFDFSAGDKVVLEYTGLVDSMNLIQDTKVVNYTKINDSQDGLPASWQDQGIFSRFYTQAYNKLKEMSLQEKIGQLILARYPDDKQEEAVQYSKLGGIVFFEKDFKNKNEADVKQMIQNLNNRSSIPLLTAVDEEGGKIVRISSNSLLVPSKFKSSKELYDAGGFPEIEKDTKNKSAVLKNLGLNLNLAPVVDVSDDPNSYMYDRTIGYDSKITGEYASTVITASKGTGVSYTLKHFPGYGNNTDTHINTAIDTRSYDEILKNDIVPFQKGIDSGAEAVLVSHNVVSAIDSKNPASLSIPIHNLLRSNLGFTGIVMTDDLDMGATNKINEKYINGLLAGNDLLIVTDYESAIKEINLGIKNNKISEELIDKLAFKVLAWKYYKGLLVEVQRENEK